LLYLSSEEPHSLRGIEDASLVKALNVAGFSARVNV